MLLFLVYDHSLLFSTVEVFAVCYVFSCWFTMRITAGVMGYAAIASRVRRGYDLFLSFISSLIALCSSRPSFLNSLIFVLDSVLASEWNLSFKASHAA